MLANIPSVVIWFFAGSGVCSLLSCLLPSNHKNAFFQLLLDAANLWSFNIHKAENKDDVRT